MTKNQDPNPKQFSNIKDPTNTKGKVFDLEPRTFRFAKDVRDFIKLLPKSIANLEDTRQLVRSSGSVGANYIEANEALGKKDFSMHAKICRKEAKESQFWLNLIDTGSDQALGLAKLRLVSEAGELLRIFSAIINKSA